MADKFDGYYNTWNPKPGNFEVPSYKEYSSIEGIWQLEYTRDKLAKYGLKDPWMRNEIWRYPKWYSEQTAPKLIEVAFGKKYVGLKRGFLIAAGIIISENIYWRLRYGHRPADADNLLDWFQEFEYSLKHRNQ